MEKIKYIDLFSGLGGFRLGFEAALKKSGLSGKCVYSADIKEHAIINYKNNFNENSRNDITQLDEEALPDFDVLLAGFPCQAFSYAGNRRGFEDTRGTLFFDVARILKVKKPEVFILENVEGLIGHDKVNKSDKIGRTLDTILKTCSNLGYKVDWKLLNSSDFGLAQNRKRIFIVGTSNDKFTGLGEFKQKKVKLKSILESNKPTIKNDKLINLLLKNYLPNELYGKSIKDKRGGSNNIHSWDLGLKGKISKKDKELLTRILKARRNKKWGAAKGVEWMDGMPLTLDEIKSFYNEANLKERLENLVRKGYLVLENPKDVVMNDKNQKIRVKRMDLEKGYNIVAGKLSFSISKILDPQAVTPTLVATDISKIGVIDGEGIRRLTANELKALFGFPKKYKITGSEDEIYDLFGNSICVNVVKEVSIHMLKYLSKVADHS